MKEISHIGIRNESFFCYHCGGSQKIPFPISIDLLTEWMKGFKKVHKNCIKTWTEPINDVDGKTEYENCNWWINHGEHGISSMTMFNHLSDHIKIDCPRENIPCDPDDFRRCHLLLEAVPQFRTKLHRLKEIPMWSNLVQNWDILTAMLEEQILTGKSNGMYEFMKSLGC